MDHRAARAEAIAARGDPPPGGEGAGEVKDKVPVPAGYREGIVGAITVVLGFSLLFMRYWSLEAPGEWDALSFVAEVLLAVAIFLELYSLWRALSLEDDEAREYRRTLRWFIASVVVLIVSLLLAAEIAAEPRLPFLKGGSSMKEKS
jgi:heme A synthase